MDELRKKEVQQIQLPYLDGVALVHQKHMELLTNLMQHQPYRTELLEIKEEKDNLLTNRPLYTELEPPLKKPIKTSKEPTDDSKTF